MTATELGDLVEWAILAGYGLACTAVGYALAVILGRLHRDPLTRAAHAEARLAATRTGKD